MTELELRKRVVETANKYYGCKEADGSHKVIIDGYNAHTPLARNYKMKYTGAWCATFVSFVAIQCGLTDIMPTECSCGRMIELYKKMGRWEENDAYAPQVGDIIMYDWDDTGVGDDTGWPEHVGIVTVVRGNDFKVIEGNKKKAVGYRNMTVNGKNIRGYCLPDYASKAEDVPAAPASNGASQTTDQDYSVNRFVMDVQSVTGSRIDGIAGPETIRNTPTISAAKNRKHAVVKYVQRRLAALGYAQVGKADGIAGPKFTAALKAFQKDNGCVVDGEATARNKTWKKLLGMK